MSFQFRDWYTDRMDIYRNAPTTTAHLTAFNPTLVASQVPCRIYRPDQRAMRFSQTSAAVEAESSLMCGLEVDIQAGDRLEITRGGGLGQEKNKVTAFAGEPVYYYEPFGASFPGLGHIVLKLKMEKRV